MTLSAITAAIASTKDEAMVRHFLAIWPLAEEIMGAFSKATQAPIFAYLNGVQVFQSAPETMPPFCGVMLDSPETRTRCVEDGERRAAKQEPDFSKDVQLCHAGMANGRREINTGMGTLVILFGSKKSTTGGALERRSQVIRAAGEENPELARRLEEADNAQPHAARIEASDLELISAIANILERLMSATVGFRSLTINMAHELSVMLLGLGLLAQEMEHLLRTHSGSPISAQLFDELLKTQAHIYTECRLGLYIVRNFLSHASETRYSEVVRPHFEPLNLKSLLLDMVDLHKRHAAAKHISFDVSGLEDTPRVLGSEMEIRRLFHNILINAIKYSYHSVKNAQRTIRIRTKIPYDPGFRRRRFALSFENYGLGLTEAERREVFKPGFRGQQAIAEVPIGSGIGLSEAAKIMKAHDGQVQLRSKELYTEAEGQTTYLTTVDLIFPYLAEK